MDLAFHSPGSNLELLVNKDLFKKLPSDLKEIIRIATIMLTHKVMANLFIEMH